MLVLSRKKGESIVIDQEIVLTVLEVRGDKVRLGVEAPGEIPIHRSEVLQRIADATKLEDVERQLTEEAAEP